MGTRKGMVHLASGLLHHGRGSCQEGHPHPAPDIHIRGLAVAELLAQLSASPAPCEEPSLVSIVHCPALKQGQSLLASPIFSSWGWGLLFPFSVLKQESHPGIHLQLSLGTAQSRGMGSIFTNQSCLLRARALACTHPAFSWLAW